MRDIGQLTDFRTHNGDQRARPCEAARPVGLLSRADVSHEFYRIADGLFAEEWICSDMATLHGQLTVGDT